MRTFNIRSNSPDLARAELEDAQYNYSRIEHAGRFSFSTKEFTAAAGADAVIIVADTRLLLWFCALSFVRRRMFHLVSVDLIYGRPKTPLQRLKARICRILLSQVDLFVVHQHDLDGYAEVLGVGPDRTVYVPFKVNLWEDLQRGEIETCDNGYLFLAGRTYRDVAVFLEACKTSRVPAVMLRHAPESALKHGTTFPVGPLPESLKQVTDNGSREDWQALLANCRAVVLPILPGVINAAGISTLFDSFGLGKPVIITDCPATRGIITDREAAIVPPGDAEALGAAMERVFEDADYRSSLARAGRAMAQSLQGATRYHTDIMRFVISRIVAPRHH